ncbi:hypothetical protein [Novosphingobium sp.]|uniref:hypothetical protein n=1 Tax=Novosphingobium sp. TaxID=1874826 RepID=UPI003D6D8DEF
MSYNEAGAIDRVDFLLDLEIPQPLPGPRGILVWVKAVSVNPVDVNPDRIEQHKLPEEVLALVDAGVLQTLTRTSSPINAANLKEVHGIVERGKVIGKTVIEGF